MRALDLSVLRFFARRFRFLRNLPAEYLDWAPRDAHHGLAGLYIVIATFFGVFAAVFDNPAWRVPMSVVAGTCLGFAVANSVNGELGHSAANYRSHRGWSTFWLLVACACGLGFGAVMATVPS